MNVYWTPVAEKRAAQLIASMSGDRTGAAWRWQFALQGRIRGLAREEATEGIYEALFSPCRIVYRIERDRLVILTLHPAAAHRKSARYEERLPGAPPAAPDHS